MNGFLLANAFGGGMLAALSPCAFAMLPSFVAFYLGVKEPGYEQIPVSRRLAQALGISGLATLGFLTIYGTGGMLVSLGLSALFDWTPYLIIPVAIGLILLGGGLLIGRSLSVPIPRPNWAVRGGGALGAYLYGVSYALASAACTLPVFVAAIGSAVAVGGLVTSVESLVVFGLGMGAVILSVALGATLFQGAVARWVRTFVPHVRTASGFLLILAGFYLVGFMLYYYFGVGRAVSMPIG